MVVDVTLALSVFVVSLLKSLYLCCLSVNVPEMFFLISPLILSSIYPKGAAALLKLFF